MSKKMSVGAEKGEKNRKKRLQFLEKCIIIREQILKIIQEVGYD